MKTALSQTSIGIIGGLNLLSVSGDAPEDASYSGGAGYMFGVTAEIKIADKIKLMLQPNYSHTQTGIGIDIGEEDPKDSFDVSFNFYRIPLLAKIEAFNNVTYFLSGLDFGFLKDAKIQDVNKTKDAKDISDKINDIDLAAVFGAGVKFRVSNFNLGIEARYNQSLINMAKDNNGQTFDDLPPRFRQSGFQLLSCITFNL
jgi:hypothetical protein